MSSLKLAIGAHHDKNKSVQTFTINNETKFPLVLNYFVKIGIKSIMCIHQIKVIKIVCIILSVIVYSCNNRTYLISRHWNSLYFRITKIQRILHSRHICNMLFQRIDNPHKISLVVYYSQIIYIIHTFRSKINYFVLPHINHVWSLKILIYHCPDIFCLHKTLSDSSIKNMEYTIAYFQCIQQN